MEEIIEEKCTELMKEKFPKFLPYLKDCSKSFGPDLGIVMQMLPFGEYAVDVIKSKDEVEMKRIFDFIEFLLCNGNESVQNAAATGFLEYLSNSYPDEIQFTTFVKYLGKESIGYCKAWDEFTGVKTKGLWEE